MNKWVTVTQSKAECDDLLMADLYKRELMDTKIFVSGLFDRTKDTQVVSKYKRLKTKKPIK